MAQKSLGIVSHYETEIILGGFLLVIFWASTWGLLEELVDYIEEKFKLSKVSIYFGLLGLVLVLMYLFPCFLKRF